MSPTPNRRRSRPRATRALALAALLVGAIGIEGCATWSSLTRWIPFVGRRNHAADVRAKQPGSEPVAKAEKPAKPPKKAKRPREAKVPRAPKPEVAAERAAAEARRAREPYWPYADAVRLIDADSTAAAERALTVSLERDPGYVPALARLTRLWYAAGRHDEAVRLLEEARTRAAGRPAGFPAALRAGLALHYDAIGQPARARAALGEIDGRDDRDARMAAVVLMLRGEHPDSAAALAREVVDDQPKSAIQHNNWGITRLRAGEVDAARRAFLRAIDLDPALPGPYYNLAILEKYYRLNDAPAAEWFDRYWERSQADPDGLAGVFGKTPAADLAGDPE